MVHPNSMSRICWDSVACLLLSYSAFIIPMAAFNLPQYPFLLCMEWLNIVYWSCDIGASMVTGVYIKSEVELRFREVVRRYASRWLVFDVGILIPEFVFLVFDAVQASESNNASDAAPLARTLRTTRVVRAMRYFRLVRLLRAIKVNKFLDDFKHRTNNEFTLVGMKLGKLLAVVAILAHLLACIWYSVGDVERGWIYTQGVASRPLWDRYGYSFQFALAHLHPSNLDQIFDLNTSAERMWAICATFNAMIVSSLFISTVTNYMSEIRSSRQQRSSKLSIIREYAQRYALSQRLDFQLKQYIQTKYEKHLHDAAEQELIQVLPQQLSIELRREMWSPTLLVHPYFKTIHLSHSRTERDLCHKAVVEHGVFEDDVVFSVGVACSKMYFPTGGRFKYAGQSRFAVDDDSSDEDQPHNVIVDIDTWLCEAVLWTSWHHLGDLTALSNGLLVTVDTDLFATVVQEHSSSLEDTVRYARFFVDAINSNARIISDLSDWVKWPRSGASQGLSVVAVHPMRSSSMKTGL